MPWACRSVQKCTSMMATSTVLLRVGELGAAKSHRQGRCDYFHRISRLSLTHTLARFIPFQFPFLFNYLTIFVFTIDC